MATVKIDRIGEWAGIIQLDSKLSEYDLPSYFFTGPDQDELKPMAIERLRIWLVEEFWWEAEFGVDFDGENHIKKPDQPDDDFYQIGGPGLTIQGPLRLVTNLNDEYQAKHTDPPDWKFFSPLTSNGLAPPDQCKRLVLQSTEWVFQLLSAVDLPDFPELEDPPEPVDVCELHPDFCEPVPEDEPEAEPEPEEPPEAEPEPENPMTGDRPLSASPSSSPSPYPTPNALPWLPASPKLRVAFKPRLHAEHSRATIAYIGVAISTNQDMCTRLAQMNAMKCLGRLAAGATGAVAESLHRTASALAATISSNRMEAREIIVCFSNGSEGSRRRLWGVAQRLEFGLEVVHQSASMCLHALRNYPTVNWHALDMATRYCKLAERHLGLALAQLLRESCIPERGPMARST